MDARERLQRETEGQGTMKMRVTKKRRVQMNEE